MKVLKLHLLFLSMVVMIIKGIQGQVSTSISPFLSLSGMESNLQTSCLTKPSTADRPAVVPSAVPAIPSAGLSSLSAFGLPGLITTASGVFSPSVTHISGLPTLYPCKIDSKTVPLMFKTPKPSGATTSDPDKDVLNNLAIALQLLIVSNLMKAPNNELETGKEISFAKLLDLIPLPSPAHVPTTPLKISTSSSSTRSSIPITTVRLLSSTNYAQPNVIPPLNIAPVPPLPTQIPNIPGPFMITQPAVYISQQTPVHDAPKATSNPGIQSPLLRHFQYTPSPHTQSTISPATSQIDSPSDTQSPQCDRERSMHYLQPYSSVTSTNPESPPSMLPNANFVGASNFVNPYPNSILNPTAVQSSRSLNIMSPYDSIASNSPQADAFPQFSLNGMTYPNKDFQFPCCGRSSDDRMDGVSNNVY